MHTYKYTYNNYAKHAYKCIRETVPSPPSSQYQRTLVGRSG